MRAHGMGHPSIQGGGAMSSPYSEGGALFGLGLIHANHGEDITKCAALCGPLSPSTLVPPDL